MKDFTLTLPTKIFFGNSKHQDFITSLDEYAPNILLVTGGNSIKKHGFYDPVLTSLKKSFEVFEFSGIEPNPLHSTINKCAKEFSEKNIGLVLGFGGGSVMDASKAIAALLYIYKNNLTKDFPTDIWPFVLGGEFFNKLPGALPLAMIPTTAATASEVTPFAVISNSEINGKSTLNYEFFKSKISWINPTFTTRLPPTVTADGAADILSHVFENYLIGGDDAQFTDYYCEGIIKTVLENLPILLDDPFNLKARANLMWCSTMALNGLHNVGRNPSIFPLHAIEHSMSAVKHELAHGRGLATLFPSYFRYLWNRNRARDRFCKLNVSIFNSRPETSGLSFILEFENWLKQNSLSQSIYDLGFNDQDIMKIADYTIKTYGKGQPLQALGEISHSDVVEILKMTVD